MQRRRLLYALTGLGAALAGGWWGQRHLLPSVNRPKEAGGGQGVWITAPPPEGGGDPAGKRFWQGKTLVMNFWATWCPPCVEEMPMLERLYQEAKDGKVSLVGIAIDHADKVQQFAKNHAITFPVMAAGLSGLELSQVLGNVSKTLPFTARILSDGTIERIKNGKLEEEEAKKWLNIES